MSTETATSMVELAQSDPEYASKLVKELMDTKAENELLKEAVDALGQREQEAQQALRQARGISTYLKGKQEDLQKDDVKGKLALRQANGISLYLKNKNEELKNKLKDAERVEIEAQLALRQAKGVSAYLQKKNVSLEKKLHAAKTEDAAKRAFLKARDTSVALRTSLLLEDQNPIEEVSDHEEPASVVSTDDEADKELPENSAVNEDETQGLSFTDQLYMASLVVMAVGMAMS